VDADLNPILTRSEVYSGVYGRASITFYAFNSSGNRGIACGLNNLQKIRDGEPLGGKASAEFDFATDDDEDKTDGVTIRDSIGREQNPIVINESGLYSLILGSKLPTARRCLPSAGMACTPSTTSWQTRTSPSQPCRSSRRNARKDSGSGVTALGSFCYLCHAQQTKGTAAHPLIAMGDSLLLIMALLSSHPRYHHSNGLSASRLRLDLFSQSC